MSALDLTPFGYSNTPEGPVPNEGEQRLMQLVADLRGAGLSLAGTQALLHCHGLCDRRKSRGDAALAVALAWTDEDRAAVAAWAGAASVRVVDECGPEGWQWAIALMRHHGAGLIVSARLESWPWTAADAAGMENHAAHYGGRWTFADGQHAGSDAAARFARGCVLAVREYRRAADAAGGAS